ncbi:MAG: glycosyl hydrolase [Melioribacteraceae bacterium]|nr:glycosyl hydrolase [Melioribacteraceae bacterium]MCF8353269.1 glycosyl hydrolase [Melioribacteraceae bacterium]MCF8394845.1 glycosyl hydrolase [Melioribacteraceae bacterium]MCF8418796.1 glycosyl hydrolase [Melioribacteraceae bacterium]
MRRFISLLCIFLISLTFITFAQDEEKDKLTSTTFSGLKWRGIGPARTSGRISDFAVNQNNINEYYVATSSGHLWKTTNSGTTWDAVADTLPYSLGVVTIDPNNEHTVWVGTGENNHQRALGYGDGVYKSTDGGSSWTRLGLKESRQIGGIIIDPGNSDIVYVAAEGSAWGPGGDRGLYKTSDGGKTWNKILDISLHTGVNNVVMDPRDSNVLYATSEQRRRTAFTKIGGGPESAVYKSTDGGETWDKIMKGLPGVHLGGMGIDISPVNPDVIYLSVEAAEDKGGFFRSTNRGASWKKMSDTYASGQYFNEIFADPNFVDRVYIMDVVSKYTEDGGKTWQNLGLSDRHVDDHAFWINPDNSNHLLVGGDGGVYESFDLGAHWEFKTNLPVTQFYRVTVDNEEPFYNIYGGTQDNATLGGPSQTFSNDGITNADWIVTVFGDGFVTQVDPTNPDIVYSEWQYGNIVRYDKKNGETLTIRPEPKKGEKMYKWYWDTPFIISPHSPSRLYIAAERVFRSDDRGEHWEVISGDLTTQTDRNSFKVMDKYWSVDAVVKDVSTSQWGLIISLDESRIQENLLYIGTDDGIIQRTEDANNWTRLDKFPDVPEFTPVHDVSSSRHDANVVYAVFNNHKSDDFKPYVLKSNDKGNSWISIAGNLPQNGAVSSIVEDPVNPNLLFVGTEWGVYFTVDGGEKWMQLKNGMPKVKVPELVIQEREMDLVAGTFGRGFYILDNYSPLREVTSELFNKDAHMFKIKNAYMFRTHMGKYGQGSTFYRAPNPEYGAVFTYYVKDVPKTLKAERKKKEGELFNEGKPIPQPTYEELKAEEDEIAPYFLFTITDSNGNIVKKFSKSASAGIHRESWDLTHTSYNPVRMKNNKFDPTSNPGSSLSVIPGKYYVSMSMVVRREEKQLIPPTEFNVKLLETHTLPPTKPEDKIQFEKDALELARKVVGARELTEELVNKIEILKQTAQKTPAETNEVMNKLFDVSKKLDAIMFDFNGRPAKASTEEIPPAIVPLNWRLNDLTGPSMYTHANITQSQKTAFEILSDALPGIVSQLKTIMTIDIPGIESNLKELGAVWAPGMLLD